VSGPTDDSGMTEDQIAAEIRDHLIRKNGGQAPIRVKTDAPLSVTGQWSNEPPEAS